MIALPAWIKKNSDRLRQIRRKQPRVTSEQAAKQCKNVARRSGSSQPNGSH
jgi:hypothetical protein